MTPARATGSSASARARPAASASHASAPTRPGTPCPPRRRRAPAGVASRPVAHASLATLLRQSARAAPRPRAADRAAARALVHVPGRGEFFCATRGGDGPALRCCTAGWCRPTSTGSRSYDRCATPGTASSRSTIAATAGALRGPAPFRLGDCARRRRGASSATSGARRASIARRLLDGRADRVPARARPRGPSSAGSSSARPRPTGRSRAMKRGRRLMSLAAPRARPLPERALAAPPSARSGCPTESARTWAAAELVARQRSRHRRGRPRARPLRRPLVARRARQPRAVDRAAPATRSCRRASSASSRRSWTSRRGRCPAPTSRVTTHPEPFVAALLDALTDVRGPGYASGPMKRYHVTTFGCQMNEHDSERMKGMLESLGYAEAADARRTPTSSSSTPARSARRPTTGSSPTSARRSGSSASAPSASSASAGCWAQSVKDEVFAPLPVRRRRVRPRPGAQARRVPDERLAHRAGLLRVRGLHRPPARRSAPASSRRGCRSPSAATAAARTASSRRRADARSRARSTSSSPRSSASPPTACAR